MPSREEIEDADLWLPASKLALIDRQSVLLLGEPGVGKTCVLRAMRRRLPQAGFRLTYCRNATLGRRDFYRHLCHTLGLHSPATIEDTDEYVRFRLAAAGSDRALSPTTRSPACTSTRRERSAR